MRQLVHVMSFAVQDIHKKVGNHASIMLSPSQHLLIAHFPPPLKVEEEGYVQTTSRSFNYRCGIHRLVGFQDAHALHLATNRLPFQ